MLWGEICEQFWVNKKPTNKHQQKSFLRVRSDRNNSQQKEWKNVYINNTILIFTNKQIL